MAELRTDYSPILGPIALASFGTFTEERALVSGKSLREGLLASLWTVELLAAQAGIVPWIEVPGSGRGVAVIGAARSKMHVYGDPNFEAVKTIYLAAHSAARSAQAHALPWGGGKVPPMGGQQVGDLGVSTLIVLTVIGVAAICASAWFGRSAVEQMVTTHGEDLRASYAADAAAKVAMAQIAAGQTVDPSVYSALGSLAAREQRDSFFVPGVLIGGAAVAAGVAGWALWKGAKHVF